MNNKLNRKENKEDIADIVSIINKSFSEKRDVNRIPVILKELEKFWINNSDLRFGQIISILSSKLECDDFNAEDDSWLDILYGLNEDIENTIEIKELEDSDNVDEDYEKGFEIRCLACNRTNCTLQEEIDYDWDENPYTSGYYVICNDCGNSDMRLV